MARRADGRAVDKRFGFFVNHDLAGYEVHVHANIPHQDVIFLYEADDKVSTMKAKGGGELAICGVGAAVANAIYNVTGIRMREYPITLDKHLDRLPEMAWDLPTMRRHRYAIDVPQHLFQSKIFISAERAQDAREEDCLEPRSPQACFASSTRSQPSGY